MKISKIDVMLVKSISEFYRGVDNTIENNPILDSAVIWEEINKNCKDDIGYAIFDFIGIPKDTTLEHMDGKCPECLIKNESCSACYCRDWATDVFGDYIVGKIGFEEMLKKLDVVVE